MKNRMFCRVAVFFVPVLAKAFGQDSGGFVDQKYTISAPGINASFINYGARLTNLFVHDKDGVVRDVVLGYDTPKEYINDTNGAHTYYGMSSLTGDIL